MNLVDIIDHNIPTIQLTDTLEDAEQLMFDFQVESLALLDENKEFLALIPLDFVEEQLFQRKKTSFSEIYDIMYLKKAVLTDTHPYDIARYLIENNLDTVPVIDKEGQYKGMIEKASLFDYFIEQSGIVNPGAIIALKIPQSEYILSNIIRVCENNDVYVLHVQVNQIPGSGGLDLEVILKTNSTDLRVIKSAFQRYNYHILYTSGNLVEDDDLDRRYKLLMNYINM